MADLTYHPVLADSAAQLANAEPARLLVLGEELPDGYEAAAELRLLEEPEVWLPSGVYVCATDQGALAVFVDGPTAPGPATATTWTEAPDEHPLVQSYAWFERFWDEGAPVPAPRFQAGQDVRTLNGGQPALIRSRNFQDGHWSYTVRIDNQSKVLSEAALAAEELDDDPQDWVKRPPSPVDRFAATLTRAKLGENLTDTVYSFRATRTVFRPYQFKPIIRLLSSGRMRLLIADEVGLGKTIEAGLVWTELDARRQADRVLIVCPSMLVAKWKQEMRERFGFELTELTRDVLDEFLDDMENDRRRSRSAWICSLERLRGWDGLERMAELSPQFDLVIADEAHAFRNSGTRSNILGSLLADWADALVFLSATPLNLGNQDLYNLLELLAPGEFDDRTVLEQRLEPNAVLNRVGASLFDPGVANTTRRMWLHEVRDLTFGPAVTGRPEYQQLDALLSLDRLDHGQIAEAKRLVAELHTLSAVVSRTRKVEVQENKAVRDAWSIHVEWTDDEAKLYQLIHAWQFARARRKRMPVGFVTQMPLRLASSCLPAARDLVLAAASAPSPRALVEDDEEELDELDGLDAFADDDDDVDELEERWRDLDLDLRPPDEVIAAAERLGSVDTKFDAFMPKLRDVLEQDRRVLVFTFSRRTLGYLTDRLRSKGIRIAVMHGDVPREERLQIMRRFRDGEFDVLLASRVASEGLDFEFASAVVNYDLPWNPMEVEQRIGRIDRIGQQHEKIYVLNFHTPGTIETDIVERVHLRIGVFEDSIGELEPILQSKLRDLRRAMLDPELTPEERRRRTDEQLTAIEEQKKSVGDLENASSFLASADQAEIEGLEADLVTSGRYVGQRELVLLLQDWVAPAHGATCKVDPSGRWLFLRGNRSLDQQLSALQSKGERSQRELEVLSNRLRDEVEIQLCLDPELARTTGSDLLNANHPLVRAALRVPGAGEAKFSSVRITNADVTPGTYLTLVALANWNGIRSASEFWTESVTLDGRPAPAEVGYAVLAALAEAELDPAPIPLDADAAWLVRRANRQLLQRQTREEARRSAENEAIVKTRRMSVENVHERKVGQIQRRLESLRRSGASKVIHLQEAQLAKQAQRLEQQLKDLEARRGGELSLEYKAVCFVEVAGNERERS